MFIIWKFPKTSQATCLRPLHYMHIHFLPAGRDSAPSTNSHQVGLYTASYLLLAQIGNSAIDNLTFPHAPLGSEHPSLENSWGLNYSDRLPGSMHSEKNIKT